MAMIKVYEATVRKYVKVRFNIDVRKYFFQIVLLIDGKIWIRTLLMHLA